MARVALSATVKHSGARSLQVERVAREDTAKFTIATVPVTPGGRYYFSCYVKATDGTPTVLLEFPGAAGDVPDAATTAPDASIRYGGHALYWERQLSDRPDEFNRIDLAFTAPAGATRLQVGVAYGWALGTAWYDDFRLYALDSAGAAAGQK